MFKIISAVVTAFYQNCRLLVIPETKQAVVVDPGGEVEILLGVILENALKVDAIWLTHSHLDHVGGVKPLKEWSNAPIYGHKEEAFLRQGVEAQLKLYGLPRGTMENCPEPDHYIKGGDTIKFGPYDFQVLDTPGHSPGHLSFYCAQLKIVLAGDTLFAGSIGRTDLPGGNHEQLMKSIRDKLFTLPRDTEVLSGHGPNTTIGQELDTNPFFKK